MGATVKTLPQTGSKNDAKTVFRTSAASAAQSVYRDAETEGTRYGKRLARKVLQSQFADMTPEQIVTSLLEE